VTWFGKYLCDQFMLAAAERYLTRTEYEAVLPDGMLFWDSFEYQEGVKLAIGRETVHKTLMMRRFRGDRVRCCRRRRA
jgi:hypothetical protein